LKEGRGAVSQASRSRLANALIVLQVALSVVLLVGAGLFLHTLVDLNNLDTGFNKQNVLLFSIDPAGVGYKEDARLTNLYQQIEQKVGAEPGVRAVSVSFFTFHQGAWDGPVTLAGHTLKPGVDNDVFHNVVGSGYFATMGIPLLAGRVFGPHDMANSPKVAVINETMAREFYPGVSPVGQRFGFGLDGKPDIEIVGVVKDAKYTNLRNKAKAAAYYPYTQHPAYYNDLEVRYMGKKPAIIAEVRRAVAEVDRRLPVFYQNTLAQQVDQSISGASLVAQLSTFFGLAAVLLACLGIYGLMSYAVTRRTNEIGIRMALGAERSNVLWIVMRQSLLLAGLGIVIGLPVALGAEQLVSKMLFGVRPADPVSMAGAAILLLIFALVAGYLPARRASRIDPMVALRCE
ncbi:MAG: FtsX-like permease family protein, partial [Bryobacteraceae bacterium]